MSWGVESPWRAKRRQQERNLRMERSRRPISTRLDEIKEKLQEGDIGMDEALMLAYSEGAFDGKRAEPVVVRVGKQHTPEIET